MSDFVKIVENIKSFMEPHESMQAFCDRVNARLMEVAPAERRLSYGAVNTTLRGKFNPTDSTIKRFALGLDTTEIFLRFNVGPKHPTTQVRRRTAKTA